MKDIETLHFPEDVRYAPDHEWARKEDTLISAGISDYAQDQLGDIVFVELPEVGSTFQKGDVFGTVESVKAVSELFMTVSGEVVQINEKLEDAPELVNSDPYGEGWMIKIKTSDSTDFDRLMDRQAYLSHLKG